MSGFYKVAREGLLSQSEQERVLGFLKPGAAPVITEVTDASYLVSVHEQAHFDDIANTFWGLVLTCETEASEVSNRLLGLIDVHKMRVTSLLSAAWDVMEGSAVCAEFIQLLVTEGTDDIESFFETLPDDYKRAFLKVAATTIPGLVLNPETAPQSPLGAVTIIATKAAIVELSLDLSVLNKIEELDSYKSLRQAVMRSNPAENLAVISKHVSALMTDRMGENLLKVGDPEEPLSIEELGRNAVIASKNTIIQSIFEDSQGCMSRQSFIDKKFSFRESFERTHRNHRKLRKARTSPTVRVSDVTGGNKILSEFKFSNHETDPKQFMASCSKDHDMHKAIYESGYLEAYRSKLIFPFMSALKSERKKYITTLHWFALPSAEGGGVMNFMNNIPTSIMTADDLDELDRQDIEDKRDIGWIDFALFDRQTKGKLYMEEFWMTRRRPVLLWAPIFDDSEIIAFMDRYSDEVVLSVGPPPGPLKFQLLILSFKNLRIFWLDSGMNSLRAIEERGGVHYRGDLYANFSAPPEDYLFLSAYVLALHYMPNFLPLIGVNTSVE